MTIGLLTTINRHVTTEQVQWFFPDAESTPVTGSADHARPGEIRDHACDGLLHLVRRHDEIADHTPFGRIAIEPPAHQDGLARDPVTCKTRHAQIGRAWNDAFLAG